MKRILSFKQWAAALILFAGFTAATLFGYIRSHTDDRFESFTEDFFLNELQSNPIHFHYSVDDASVYKIDEAKLKLPVYHAGDAANDVYALSQLSEQLEKFDPENLSEANRYLYRLLRSYIDGVKDTAAYPYFSEPLSPSSGAPSELPVLLAEYRFDTVKDVELYLSILEQIPDYFSGLIVFEKEKADAGLFMSDTTADKVIKQCDALMDRKQLESHTHFLETTFNQRVEALAEQGLLTDEDVLAYQARHDRLLTTVVAPAYERLGDELTLLKGSGKDVCGLAHYPGGREYYKALLHLRTGSSRGVYEIKQLLYQDLTSNYKALRELLESDPALREQLTADQALLPEMSPDEMLDYLADVIRQTYPAIPESAGGEPDTYPSMDAPSQTEKKSNTDSGTVTCTVKYVDDSLEPYTAPAFYMTPPIDNVLNNTIYINAQDTPGDISLFTTLAHEGYPGHLYQTVYSQQFRQQTGRSPLQNVLYYGGFVEGWAMYAELSSYDYAAALAKEAHPEAVNYYLVCRLDRQIQLCLYALLDIAIHYDGASFENVYRIFASLGALDADTVSAVYSYIAEEPCNYPKYYLGYLEIIELKKQAAAVWYNDAKTASACNDPAFLYDFHRFLLENGPADFRTLSTLLTSVYDSSGYRTLSTDPKKMIQLR